MSIVDALMELLFESTVESGKQQAASALPDNPLAEEHFDKKGRSILTRTQQEALRKIHKKSLARTDY